MAGQDAAPARGVRNRASGTPRATVRSNYVGLPSMAGRGPDERRRKLPGSGGPKRAVRARKHGPEAPNRHSDDRAKGLARRLCLPVAAGAGARLAVVADRQPAARRGDRRRPHCLRDRAAPFRSHRPCLSRGDRPCPAAGVAPRGGRGRRNRHGRLHHPLICSIGKPSSRCGASSPRLRASRSCSISNARAAIACGSPALVNRSQKHRRAKPVDWVARGETCDESR